MLTPATLLFDAFLGFCSLAIPVAGIVLLYLAANPRARVVEVRAPVRTRGKHHGVEDPAPVKEESTLERPTLMRRLRWMERLHEPAVLVPLIAGVLLAFLPLVGTSLVESAYPAAQDEPHALRGTPHDLTREDGSRIHVEVFGPGDAPTLILTHGWGANSSEWYYAKRHLTDRFRVIVWDLPGLGESQEPKAGVSMEGMARDLHAVLGVAGGRPVVLVGHSIGGMINLTFCRLFPDALGGQVTGMVQIDSTYTNPVKTTKNSSVNQAIQRPIGEPMLRLMEHTAPLVQAMNYLSYREGFIQWNNARNAFAGSETRGQLDMVSRYDFQESRAVVARGTLAMLHWDETAVLPQIRVPVLMVVGFDDTTTLPAASDYMQKNIPEAQLQYFDPGAHYTLLEQNENVDRVVGEFASERLK